MALEEYRQRIQEHGFMEEPVLELTEELGRELGQNSTSQVRRFYNAIKALERQAKEEIQVKPQLVRLKSQVAYAYARAQKREKDHGVAFAKFKGFLDASLERVLNDPSELRDFARFFEIVYGFYYPYGKER